MNNKIWFGTMVAFAALLCAAAVILSPQTPKAWADASDSSYVLAYEDNFNDGALNTADWYYRDSDTIRYGGYSQKENVAVETADQIGYLQIDYNKWDVDQNGVDDLVGGGIISKRTFGYGYYEAKINFYDAGQGFHQSFWNTGVGYYASFSNEYKYNEDANDELVPWSNNMLEIDAIELDSDYNSGGANFHWHQPAFSTPAGAHHSYSSSYVDTSDWVTVAFDWRPGVIIYYINGVERHRVTYTDTRYAPQEVWLSGLANNNWGSGTPGPGASMKVDFFKYYAKAYPGANLLGNNGFETIGSNNTEIVNNWIEADGVSGVPDTDASKIVAALDAPEGSSYLKHENATGGYTIQTKQRLDYIPNGTYKLTAMVKSSGGQTEASMKVLNNGVPQALAIPASSVWTPITLDNIPVTANRADITFTSIASAGQWLQVDKVKFELNPEHIDRNIIVDNGNPGYSESGTWISSSLPGYNNTNTRYAGSAIGPSAQWTPTLPSAGEYDVYVYKVVYPNSDPNAKITIVHEGGSAIQYVNYSSGSSGWVHVGRYSFAAGTGGTVTNALNTAGKYARADAVKFVPVEILVDNGDPEYSESGSWSDSGLTGYNGTISRFSSNTGSQTATWNPNLPLQGDYRVYIYKIVHATSDPNAQIEIGHQGGPTTVYANYSTGTSGWVDLGVYAFDEGLSGSVTLARNTSGKNARADAVKWVRVD